MSILGNTPVPEFVARYWQKEPLLIRNSATRVRGPTTTDELFALACDEEVESRVVLFDRPGGIWTCESGPFEAQQLSELPERDWTLLVQAVDQWIPEAGALFSEFAFLPRWRLEDVMVSYASNGGGVGPHFDYYDVFLIQVSGSRRWQVGRRCDAHTPLLEHPSLKLLAEFDEVTRHDLETGDVLYLPPGISHWGTATSDDCVTYSVGFRAPSHRELVEHAAQILAEGMAEDLRFMDSESSIDPDPFRINQAALDALLRTWTNVGDARVAAALGQAFGSQVTEPRYPDLIGADDDFISAVRAMDQPREWDHNPLSRFAYRVTADGATLFVDGEHFETSVALARGICHRQIATPASVTGDERDLLLLLLKRGSLALR